VTLHYFFDSYEKTFSKKLSAAAGEFLSANVKFKLAGISDSPSQFWKDNDYFVTQINVSREYTITIKVSDAAANVIFRTALGDRSKETGYLKLKDITELEATVLNAFNEHLYKKTSDNFLTAKELQSIELNINNPEEEPQICLTFYLCANTSDEAGKIILMFPQFLIRSIEPLSQPESILELDNFNSCFVETDIIVGHSRITLEEVKNLEQEDIIILEKSNMYAMTLKNLNNSILNINPDPGILINLDNDNGGEIMKEAAGNIWDNLEVEMSAEFEKVKIRLGDLRQVVEGLVIDLASISENKIFLNVEQRQIAAGELIIVGDKFGVKITEVYNEAKPIKAEPVAVAPQSLQQMPQSALQADIEDESEEINDSDFDFNDYEIEDDV